MNPRDTAYIDPGILGGSFAPGMTGQEYKPIQDTSSNSIFQTAEEVPSFMRWLSDRLNPVYYSSGGGYAGEAATQQVRDRVTQASAPYEKPQGIFENMYNAAHSMSDLGILGAPPMLGALSKADQSLFDAMMKIYPKLRAQRSGLSSVPIVNTIQEMGMEPDIIKQILRNAEKEKLLELIPHSGTQPLSTAESAAAIEGGPWGSKYLWWRPTE